MTATRYSIGYGPAQAAKENPHRELDTCNCTDESYCYDLSGDGEAVVVEKIKESHAVEIVEPVIVGFDETTFD